MDGPGGLDARRSPTLGLVVVAAFAVLIPTIRAVARWLERRRERP